MEKNPQGRERVDPSSIRKKQTGFDVITPELLIRLRGGEHSAYDEIYLSCFEPLNAFLRLLLHDRDQAEELCQEVFIKLWENHSTINPDSNLKSYLYVMAKSVAFNHLKHKKVVEKYNNYRLNEQPGFESSPDEKIIENELALLVRISLENMPEQRRRVFEMSRIEGLSNDEIADRLQIKPSTVRAHLHNAIKDLRELIALVIIIFSDFI